MQHDETMGRIMEAISLHQRGENNEARTLMATLWHEIGDDGDALHRCTLAHYMADLQSDSAESLRWNRRALSAAEELSEKRLSETFAGVALASFFPSLHLNLAEDYRLAGDVQAASNHLDAARRALDSIAETESTTMIRLGIDRLKARLEAI